MINLTKTQQIVLERYNDVRLLNIIDAILLANEIVEFIDYFHNNLNYVKRLFLQVLPYM